MRSSDTLSISWSVRRSNGTKRRVSSSRDTARCLASYSSFFSSNFTSFAFFSLLAFSSSSFLMSSRARCRRKARAEASTPSPDAPASTGRPRVGRGSPAKHRWLRSLRCGAGSARQPGRTPGGGVFCPCRASYVAFTTSSLALARVVCPRRAAFCCNSTFGPALWWSAAASA